MSSNGGAYAPLERSDRLAEPREAATAVAGATREFVLAIVKNDFIVKSRILKVSASSIEELADEIAEALLLGEPVFVCAFAKSFDEAIPYNDLANLRDKAKVSVWPCSRFEDLEAQPLLGRVPVPDIAAEPERQRFVVGERVEKRDIGKEWSPGYVTQLDPLRVTASDIDPAANGYPYVEVRKLSSKPVRGRTNSRIIEREH